MSVRTPVGDTNFFPLDIGMHQGSALSLFLFVLILVELSKIFQKAISWCMHFADDIMLVTESKTTLNERVEEWRLARTQRLKDSSFEDRLYAL